jgi:hypothetical protein
MKRYCLLLLAILAFSLLAARISVLSNSNNTLILKYETGTWKLNPEGDFTRLSAEEMDYSSVSGAPLLPYDEFKVAIPPGGQISCTLVNSSTESVVLPSRLIPVPYLSIKNGMSNYHYEPDETLYGNQKQALLELSASNFRGLSFVPVQINPFSYDGLTNLKVITEATISVKITGNVAYRSSEPKDTALEIILPQIVNAENAQSWTAVTRRDINYAPFTKSNWWVRIETNREGIYRINQSQLGSLPLSDLDPRQIRMFSSSGKVLQNTYDQSGAEFREIPIIVSGESDGNFDSGDYILFYGSSRDTYEQNSAVQSDPLQINPYSQNQVFWLAFGGDFPGNPLRIGNAESSTGYEKGLYSTPEIKQVESEVHRREDTGFTWYSERFFGNSIAEYEFQTTLTDVQADGAQALILRLRQEDILSGDTHRINVSVNGVPIYSNPATGNQDFTWQGSSAYSFNRPVTSLVNGTNTIRIKVIRSSTDNLFLDWYRLSYWQNLTKGSGQKQFSHPGSNVTVGYRFDLNGALDGVQVFRVNSIYDVANLTLTDGSFVSDGISSTRYFMLNPAEAYAPASLEVVNPLDLTADQSQTDNIIVTPREFLTQANTLAGRYWDLYGLHSRVILLDDLFNQFNGGHPDPGAIKLALRYYYQNLPQPRISSLTLIGLGTIDWRNHSGSSAPRNKMIVYQGDYIVSDDYFGMLNNDTYPELAIGRYPVRTAAELDIMMQNTNNYNTNPTPGWWRNSMVLLGDDLNNGDSTYEYKHTQQTEEAANSVNPSILTDRIFAMEYEYDEFQNKPRARDDMFKAINEGRLVWYYIGHGSYDKLGAEDYLNGATDMGRFNNHGKLPLFIASSCSVSHFDYWGFDSLGQKVVLMNDLGAIASYSAARLSYPDNNHPMVMFLLQSLANQRNSLGYSVMYAKMRYTGSNSNDAVYFLFGDPLLRVIPPERDSTMQITGMSKKGILHSRETAAINGTFSIDNLTGTTEVRAYDTRRSYSLGPDTTVSHRGNKIFSGSADVSGSAFSSGFIVPDDVHTGNSGLAVAYLWDPTTNKDYTSYYYPLQLSDVAVQADNPDSPTIDLYLGSKDFRPGDTVGTSTTLLATISDSNGINITGSSGHSIFLVLDNSLQPISLTDYFSYDKGSFTKGSLVYPITGLSEGQHSIQLIAFDNFNMPSVATTSFIAKKSSELALDRLLIYPNPLSKDGYITFMLSENAELNIGIYTLRGKRIRSLRTSGRQGFNKIYWDGRDEQGSTLANNTYFVKVKASSLNGNSTELTEKLVIYK